MSHLALTALAVLAILIGLLGGWVGRKTAEVTQAFMIPKMTLNNTDTDQLPTGQMAKVVQPSGIRW